MDFVTEQRNDVFIKMVHWVILQLDECCSCIIDGLRIFFVFQLVYAYVCADVCMCPHICVYMHTQLVYVCENKGKREISIHNTEG